MAVTCEACVAAAKLRNRDYVGMEKQARQKATDEKKPQAVCWNIKTGLYIDNAEGAITGGAAIRNILSNL